MNIRAVVFALLVGGRTVLSATTTLCGQYDTVNSTNGRYSFNTDVWGGYSYGVQCIYFDPTMDGNSTWLTSTWAWSEDEADVHSYANVQLISDVLPLQLSTLSELIMNFSYTLAPGNVGASTSDIAGIEDLNTRCDVVLDAFLDSDSALSADDEKGSVEIMIWLASYGGVEPTGNQTSHSLSLGGTKFALFEGVGPANQTVYSWYPSQNISSFDEDVSSMFQYLVTENYISDSIYLGLVSFGTETEHTDNSQNVTWASTILLNISQKVDDSSAVASAAASSSTTHSSSLATSTTAATTTSTVIAQATSAATLSSSSTMDSTSSTSSTSTAPSTGTTTVSHISTSTTSTTTSTSPALQTGSASQLTSGKLHSFYFFALVVLALL